MEYKDQHWIPSSYLSAWCDPNTPEKQTPYVWVCSKDGKIIRNKAPKNIFKKPNLYTEYCSDGSRDLKWEHALNRLETSFSQIKRDKLSFKFPLSEDEKFIIYHFIATMRARNVATSETYNKLWREKKLIMESLQEMWMNSEMSSKYLTIRELSDRPLPMIMPPMVRIQVSNYMSMNMAILCTETNPGFITSDSPVVWHNPESKVPFQQIGLAYDALQIIFPISPNQLFFISRIEGCEGYIDIKKEIDVDRFNLRTWLDCKESFVVNENKIKDFWLGRTILGQ